MYQVLKTSVCSGIDAAQQMPARCMWEGDSEWHLRNGWQPRVLGSRKPAAIAVKLMWYASGLLYHS